MYFIFEKPPLLSLHKFGADKKCLQNSDGCGGENFNFKFSCFKIVGHAGGVGEIKS